MFRSSLAFALLLSLPAASFAEPSFTATNLFGWTQTQLAGLPYFENYVPFTPAGATASFAPAARSNDVFVGSYDGYYGPYAARIDEGGQTNLPPLGIYYWSYTYWDGDDLHFSNGRVGFSHLLDVNTSGTAVGDSTLAGNGSSTSGYQAHAVISPGATDQWIDLTPGGSRSQAVGINNAGEIVGWQQDGGPTQGVRWRPDGTTTVLDNFGSSVTPAAINKFGRVVGDAVNVAQSYFNPRAFVSESGAATALLPLPSQGGVEYSSATAVNNSGWVAGSSWKAASPTERLASSWTRETTGQWTAYDVNELADGGDFIFQRTLAVNDEGHLLVQAKEDADFGQTALFWLAPDELLAPPPRPVGDYNDDAQVTGADFLTWQRSAGAPGPYPVHGNNADGNASGSIDGGDLVVWQSHFGASAASAAAAAVPEPAAAALAALATLAAGWQRRQNASPG
ncbi:MAG: hypothetical protein CMJ58_00120 [Planctomycetaceae bacterium]|nr:hypothetical protein [Planctomycetaceae bacterium]